EIKILAGYKRQLGSYHKCAFPAFPAFPFRKETLPPQSNSLSGSPLASLGRDPKKGTKTCPFAPLIVSVKFVQVFWKEWRGRRDSNSRPLPGRSFKHTERQRTA